LIATRCGNYLKSNYIAPPTANTRKKKFRFAGDKLQKVASHCLPREKGLFKLPVCNNKIERCYSHCSTNGLLTEWYAYAALLQFQYISSCIQLYDSFHFQQQNTLMHHFADICFFHVCCKCICHIDQNHACNIYSAVNCLCNKSS